jgi:alkylhydroperoxidase family enzyme
VARQQGLTEDIADQIDDGYEVSQLDDRQKAVLRWTDAVLDNPAGIPADVKDAVEQYLKPAELLELTMALALFHGLSRVLISLGLEPEQMETTIVATPGTRATG